jgi:hypothetical protein
MSKQELINEFASLPVAAQRQVIDFISALKQERPSRKSAAAPKGVDVSREAFVGMWKDREDLTDSSGWVRSSRRNEW